MPEETQPINQISTLEPVEFITENDFDFEHYINQSLLSIKENEIITAKVTKITKDFVNVDIKYKSEGLIPINDFLDENNNISVKVGDDIEVYLETIEDKNGQVIVSKEKADRLKTWFAVNKIYEEDGIVSGTIISKIKGGLSVDIGIKAFLPGSQVDLKPVRNLDKLIGEKFDFKILKFNQSRGNIVLSRRSILEIERLERRKSTIEILKEGAIINGTVKNITDYGVFVDLGGVDGLLHITDITWGRIVHPSEHFNIGDDIEVIILKCDEEEKVSLGYKQKIPNPWENIAQKYPIGTIIKGDIVSLTNYGAFILIEEGIEGLIHISEISWDKKIRQPSHLLNIGDQVEAVIKEIDLERNRISLSMKDLVANPWDSIADKLPTGTVVTGTIRNITDFGLFVGLDDGIDGLVHVTDLSWNQRQQNPNKMYKKGNKIKVIVLNIDKEKERLSLGIKQLTDDPWQKVENEISLGQEVTGKVVHIVDFGIFIEIRDGVEGLVHISEIENKNKKQNLTKFYNIGDTLTAKVINLSSQERRLGLSLLDDEQIVEEDVKEELPLPKEDQITEEEK